MYTGETRKYMNIVQKFLLFQLFNLKGETNIIILMNMAYENPKLGYYMKSIKEFKFSVVGPLKSMVSYCMVSTRIMHMY